MIGDLRFAWRALGRDRRFAAGVILTLALGVAVNTTVFTRLISTGIAAGLVAALAGTRVLRGLLLDVSALDPVTFAAVAVGLLAVGLAACYLPARRAARIEPLVALRNC